MLGSLGYSFRGVSLRDTDLIVNKHFWWKHITLLKNPFRRALIVYNYSADWVKFFFLKYPPVALVQPPMAALRISKHFDIYTCFRCLKRTPCFCLLPSLEFVLFLDWQAPVSSNILHTTWFPEPSPFQRSSSPCLAVSHLATLFLHMSLPRTGCSLHKGSDQEDDITVYVKLKSH